MGIVERLAPGHLPTFIVIGAMKAGTSSLHNYLNAHPKICMSKVKETDYFLPFRPKTKVSSWYLHHNIFWYKKQFLESAEQYGESSPNYTKRHIFPGVAKRMYNTVPNAKLIYVVRDPIERAISNFMHAIHAGRRSPGDLDVMLNPKNGENIILETSRYHYQIEPYLEHYPIERILFITSQDLKNNRRETIREIFEFLEVDPNFVSEEFDKLAHVTAKKGGGGRLSKPKLTKTQLEAVKRYLKPDIDKFRMLTGKEFADWSV